MKLKFQPVSLFTSTPVVFGMVVCGLLLTSPAKAQQYGIGMQPGMQGCGYPYGQANGAANESDAAQELERQIADLKNEKAQNASEIRKLDEQARKYARTIDRTILPNWGEVFKEHMKNPVYACCNEGDVAVKVPDRPQKRPRPTVPVPGEKAPRKRIPKPAPQEGESYSVNDSLSEEGSSRMPASAAETGIADDGWGPEIGEGGGAASGSGGSGDSPTSCHPAEPPFTLPKWKGVACAGPGKISPRVCSGDLFTQRENTDRGEGSCEEAITGYAEVLRQADPLRTRNSDIAREIRDLNRDLGDQRRDDRLEAGCETCQRAKQNQGGAGGNFGGTLQAMSPVLGASAGFSVGGVRVGAGITSGGPGPLAVPYGSGGYGYPMAQNGVYGAVPGGVNGAFGCAAGAGGGGNANGPYGMGGPYGQGPYQQQGAFGYPQGYMPGWPGLGGGGAYNPGYGPWGVAGPWGNSPAGISGQLSLGGGSGGGLGGILSGLLGGITRGISGIFGGGGTGGGFGFGRPGYGYAGSGGYPNFGLGTQGGAPGILPISSGSPFGGANGSPFGGQRTLSPFGVGGAGVAGVGGSPFRTTGSYSPYGVSGISGGSNYLPYMSQNTNYYNNAIGQQIQQQQLYSKYLSAQQTLGQFNSGVNSFNGGASSYYPYGSGSQQYPPSILPAVQTPYGY